MERIIKEDLIKEGYGEFNSPHLDYEGGKLLTFTVHPKVDMYYQTELMYCRLYTGNHQSRGNRILFEGKIETMDELKFIVKAITHFENYPPSKVRRQNSKAMKDNTEHVDNNNMKKPDQPGYQYAQYHKEPTPEDVIEHLKNGKPKSEHVDSKPDFEKMIEDLGWICDGSSETNDMLKLSNRIWSDYVLPLQQENDKLKEDIKDAYNAGLMCQRILSKDEIDKLKERVKVLEGINKSLKKALTEKTGAPF